MKPSAEEVADVLDRAHDEMLTRGWCQGTLTRGGAVCAVGALVHVVGGTPERTHFEIWPQDEDLIEAARDALDAQVPDNRQIAEWNDDSDRTIDDVLDAYRLTAKALRNGELEVA